MPESELGGAVLAAGRGSRMGARCEWLPKTLLPVGGRPILAYQLDLLRSLRVRRAAVLVGHHKEMVADYLATTRDLGLELDLVQQPELRGTGHGLLCLRAKLERPFVLFLGDIVLRAHDLAELVKPLLRGPTAAVLAVAPETDPASLRKNFRVELNSEGRVVRVVEKPTSSAPALKGCGVYAFTPAIFSAIEHTPPSARGEVGITESIQTLIDQGHQTRVAYVSSWDMNLTTAADLDACDQYLLRHGELRAGPPC